MRTVDLAAESPTLEQVLQLANRENLMVRTPEGREFVIAEIDDFDRELQLLRANDEFREFLRLRSAEPGRWTVEEAREKLGLP